MIFSAEILRTILNVTRFVWWNLAQISAATLQVVISDACQESVIQLNVPATIAPRLASETAPW